jgi:hypothetical protein
VSLNVTIQDVPFAILEAVKARILAQRAQRRGLQEGKPRAAKGPRPQFRRFGASSKAYRRPRPAALPDDGDRGFAHASLYGWSEFPAAYWRVYSGDFSAYLADSINLAPLGDSVGVSSFYVAYLMLPVEQDKSILVMMGRLREDYNDGATSGFRTREVVNRVFLVSLATVRQIGIPLKLQRIIDVLNPQSPEADYDYFEPPGVNTSPVPPRQIYDAAVGYASADDDWTPTIYELMNRVHSFTEIGNIQQFPLDLKPVTGDFRYGWFNPDEQNDKSRYYAEWSGNPEIVDMSRPDLLDALPDNTHIYTDNWLPDGPWQDKPDKTDEFAFAWDWDDPSYCRAMCAALGFADADLEP